MHDRDRDLGTQALAAQQHVTGSMSNWACTSIRGCTCAKPTSTLTTPSSVTRWARAGRCELPVRDESQWAAPPEGGYRRCGCFDSATLLWWSPFAAAVRPLLEVQVLIVTDQPLVALGLRHVITAIDSDTRTATAGSLADAMAMRKDSDQPVLLVIDLDTRPADRETLVTELAKLAQSQPVLALTGEPDDDEVRRLRLVKARCVRKDAAMEELRTVVLECLGDCKRRAACGSAAFSP